MRIKVALVFTLLCARAFAEPASQAASAPADGEDQMKIRALEERVNELKEKIFRSKARLVLLQEAVLHGTISGSRAIIIQKTSTSAPSSRSSTAASFRAITNSRFISSIAATVLACSAT
jgi:hypothetical protein